MKQGQYKCVSRADVFAVFLSFATGPLLLRLLFFFDTNFETVSPSCVCRQQNEQRKHVCGADSIQFVAVSVVTCIYQQHHPKKSSKPQLFCTPKTFACFSHQQSVISLFSSLPVETKSTIDFDEVFCTTAT